MEQNHSNPNAQASVGAPLPAARANAITSGARFPGEDGGRSLAEMAQRDLDAALQLLADRAQYITGATGTAIALRRDGRNDMLCRASAGSNAPELGALLSTEIGLSGESVRTRQLLRCDDAERDGRVNREVCRQQGIASVVVMPVVNDDEVLGVFELFSGKANAFGERDVSAVQRLSQMVETAVRLAQVAQRLPEQLKKAEVLAAETAKAPVSAKIEDDSSEEILDEEIFAAPMMEMSKAPEVAPVIEEVQNLPAQGTAKQSLDAVRAEAVAAPDPEPPSPAPARKMFWSAAVSAATESKEAAEADQSHVPPVLRALRKCEACGFPITAGRVLCVECEEKKWRGQLAKPAVAAREGASLGTSALPTVKADSRAFAAAARGAANPSSVASLSAFAAPAPAAAKMAVPLGVANEKPERKSQAAAQPAKAPLDEPTAKPAAKIEDLAAPSFAFTSGLESSESWFSRNKYVLGVLLLAAAVVAAFFLLR